MSDSVDRVFVHALATVRRLPRTGSSRPPPSARLRLYGLYKQSMEGDVMDIMPRPTLPVSPDNSSSNDLNNSNINDGNENGNGLHSSALGSALHRHASRDLRTREVQAEIEKWDAWYACRSMGRTEAKRKYIGTLIDTMKVYASGTTESRELVGELEFVWGQIRSQSGESDDERGDDGDRRKKTKKRRSDGRREGRTENRDGIQGKMRVLSPISQPDPISTAVGGEDDDQGITTRSPRKTRRNKNSNRKHARSRSHSRSTVSSRSLRSHSSAHDRTGRKPGDSNSDSNSGQEEEQDANEHTNNDRQRQEQQMIPNTSRDPPAPGNNEVLAQNLSSSQFRNQILLQLRTLQTEMAALREQFASRSSSSALFRRQSSSPLYSLFNSPANPFGAQYNAELAPYSLPKRTLWRTWYVAMWLGGLAARQVVINVLLVLAVILWQRWRGAGLRERRVELWARRRVRDLRSFIEKVGLGALLAGVTGDSGGNET